MTSPLFFYGLSFLIGIACRLACHPALLLPLLVGCLACKRRVLSGGVVLGCGYAWAAVTVSLPSLPESGVSGKGRFIPHTVAPSYSPFGSSIMTRGTLDAFTYGNISLKHVPCVIYTPVHRKTIPGNCASYVEGTLTRKSSAHYVFKPQTVQPEAGSYFLPQWRFSVKQSIKRYLYRLVSRKDVASFLLSMLTGEVDDRLLSLQFNRIGLLHLLGISGFQFSLLASSLSSCLRRITSDGWRYSLSIGLLTLYAFVLGDSPPIQRAWVTSTLYLIAQWGRYRISPMNALGGALLWVLIGDPCVIFHLGFQFSFLCTVAILELYPLARNLLSLWIPLRSLAQIRMLSLRDRIGHMLSWCAKEACAINLSIHLVSLPLILAHFHTFSCMSIIYNLFFPFLASILYPFLILGLIAPPFMHVAGWCTQAILGAAAYFPMALDLQLRVSWADGYWAVIALTLLYLGQQRLRRRLSVRGAL